jgi:hypothetical protein
MQVGKYAVVLCCCFYHHSNVNTARVGY